MAERSVGYWARLKGLKTALRSELPTVHSTAPQKAPQSEQMKAVPMGHLTAAQMVVHWVAHLVYQTDLPMVQRWEHLTVHQTAPQMVVHWVAHLVYQTDLMMVRRWELPTVHMTAPQMVPH